jgi:hypothetical protein
LIIGTCNAADHQGEESTHAEEPQFAAVLVLRSITVVILAIVIDILGDGQ